MKRALRSSLVYEHSGKNIPQFTVSPGEVFEAETELCSGDWLTSIDVVYSPEIIKSGNPCVVISVEGANPGDSLRVHIHDIIPDSLGYTGFLDSMRK